MLKYLNKHSYLSFLSSAAKDLVHDGDFHSWKIQGRRQLSCDVEITEENIDVLEKFCPTNMFYLSPEEVVLIKSQFIITNKTKYEDVVVNLESLNFVGNKHKDIRNYLNRYFKMDLEICSDFKNIEDVKIMLNRWSETLGGKYFQDRSGKNLFFFKNGFHHDCHNILIYNKGSLIAFAVVSPVQNEHCSYIIGKALCKDYPGISDFCDVLAFEVAYFAGAKTISMGGGSNKYKLKFSSARLQENYNLKIVGKKK